MHASTDLYTLSQDAKNGNQESRSRVKKEDRKREEDVRKASDKLKTGSISIEQFLQKSFGPPVKTSRFKRNVDSAVI